MLTKNHPVIEGFTIDSSDIDDIWSPLLYNLDSTEPLPAQIITPLIPVNHGGIVCDTSATIVSTQKI